MRTTLDDLLAIVYRHYPRGMRQHEPGFENTEEDRRLVEARRHAGREGNPWLPLLDRLEARFPDYGVQNCSIHLPTGSWDAGYSAWLWLPTRDPLEKLHKIAFYVSFIAPCYLLHSNVCRAATPTDPEQSWSDESSFTFSDDEQPIAKAIEAEIRTSFPDHEPLPPEVASIIVPDVAVGTTQFGKATLLDCLFTEYR